MEGIMKIDGYHHVGVWVKDTQKSLDFYVTGLGGKVTFSFPTADTGKLVYLVDLGNNAVVEIIPRGNGEEEVNPHIAHIALRTDDARAAYNLALKSGAASKSAPEDRMLGTMSVTNAFVLGPDHESIEFFQVH
jgi:lactoylglutathione lyase